MHTVLNTALYCFGVVVTFGGAVTFGGVVTFGGAATFGNYWKSPQLNVTFGEALLSGGRYFRNSAVS